MSSVVDASVVLAVVREEPGSDVALSKLDNALISSVNVCEVLYKIVASGGSMESAQWIIGKLPIVSIPFCNEQALVAASIHKKTHRKGISFADRACLALGLTHDVPVLTGERKWQSLGIDVKVETFR